jgi:predicted nucleic acid-binding protein
MRLIDTNVLVHAFDKDSEGRERAQEVLSYYIGTGEAVIGLQSVTEMYSALTKAMSPKDASEISEKMLESNNFKKIVSDENDILEALKIAESKGIRRSDIFDVVLAITGKRRGINTVVTENKRHFEGLGLRVETLETAKLSEDF